MKKLNDIDTMSGNGWYCDEIEFQCPVCSEELGIFSNRKKVIKCPECGSKFNIKKGFVVFYKLESLTDK